MRYCIKRLDGSVAWSGEADSFLDALQETLSRDDRPKIEDIDLSGQDLSEVPIVPCIDRAILDAVSRPRFAINMRQWHSCETTHCRAGWAVHLAGEAGYALENRGWGAFSAGSAAVAGSLIYAASRPGQPVPDFYCRTEEAIDDLERCCGVPLSRPDAGSGQEGTA